MKSKAETYVGFAIKKRAVIFGVDGIVRTLKGANNKISLILITESLSENSRDAISNALSARFSQMFGSETQGTFECQTIDTATIQDMEILRQRNCKAIAICDCELAKAIRENLQ